MRTVIRCFSSFNLENGIYEIRIKSICLFYKRASAYAMTTLARTRALADARSIRAKCTSSNSFFFLFFCHILQTARMGTKGTRQREYGMSKGKQQSRKQCWQNGKKVRQPHTHVLTWFNLLLRFFSSTVRLIYRCIGRFGSFAAETFSVINYWIKYRNESKIRLKTTSECWAACPRVNITSLVVVSLRRRVPLAIAVFILSFGHSLRAIYWKIGFLFPSMRDCKQHAEWEGKGREGLGRVGKGVGSAMRFSLVYVRACAFPHFATFFVCFRKFIKCANAFLNFQVYRISPPNDFSI